MRLFGILILLVGIQSASAQIFKIDQVNKLPGAVNSEAEESLPFFSPDSSNLYFMRTFDERNEAGVNDQDIWVSKRDEDGGYSQGKPLKEFNSKFNNAVIGLGNKGRVIYLLNTYDGKRDLEKGLSKSEYDDKSGWSKPQKIEIPELTIKGNYYGFHVSKDEEYIMISYAGDNTLGQEDLYVSIKKEGNWSAPLNLGNVINTAGFEMSPFLSPNSDTLFFSSNGHGGFGDADIFYSVRLDDTWTNWSIPTNLGDQVNTPAFDACFSYHQNRIYWSSNRDGGLSDIYTALLIEPDMLSLSADKKDVTIYQGQDGEIDLTVTGGVGPFTYSWSNDMNTEDLADIPAGEYTVRVIDARGQEAELSVTINQPDELIAEVGDDLGKILNLNPIYFDINSSYIRSDAKVELDKIVKVMNENPGLTIEIGSHTDCRATEKYNMWLSDRRAKSTLQYIQGRISNPARIDGKGYGESRLVNDCACEGEQVSDCSEEQHQLNRRTEFVIVKR